MHERRSTPRQRVLKAGKIEFEGIQVECTVRNISESGAGLEVASPIGIPHEITLKIPTRGVRKRGYIVWRYSERIGVTFE